MRTPSRSSTSSASRSTNETVSLSVSRHWNRWTPKSGPNISNSYNFYFTVALGNASNADARIKRENRQSCRPLPLSSSDGHNDDLFRIDKRGTSTWCGWPHLGLSCRARQARRGSGRNRHAWRRGSGFALPISKLISEARSEEGARLSSNFWNRNGVSHEISVAIDRIWRSWEETED